MGKGPIRVLGRLTTVSNLLGLGRWMESVWGWGILAPTNISSSSAYSQVWEIQGQLPPLKPEESHPAPLFEPDSPSLLSSRCHSPLSTTSGSGGHLQSRAFLLSSSSLQDRQTTFVGSHYDSQITSHFSSLWGSQFFLLYLYRALCSCGFENLGETLSLNEISFLAAICFDVFLSLMLICDLIMSPPPKKLCLTWQFLMEVTRKEGLSWEANLAAHASTILFLTFTSLCVICKANKASVQSCSENLFAIGLSLNMLLSCSHRIFLLGPHAWRPYRNFGCENLTPCLKR